MAHETGVTGLRLGLCDGIERSLRELLRLAVGDAARSGGARHGWVVHACPVSVEHGDSLNSITNSFRKGFIHEKAFSKRLLIG